MFVVVEGPVGVGKSTLATGVSDKLGARFFADPLVRAGRFAHIGEGDHLSTEIEFLFQRMKQLAEIKKHCQSSSIPIIADWDLSKVQYFASEELGAGDYEVLAGFTDLVKRASPIPDVFVLVQATVDQILERIAKRGREFERRITAARVQGMIVRFEEIAQSLESRGVVRVIRFDNADGIESSLQTLLHDLTLYCGQAA